MRELCHTWSKQLVMSLSGLKRLWVTSLSIITHNYLLCRFVLQPLSLINSWQTFLTLNLRLKRLCEANFWQLTTGLNSVQRFPQCFIAEVGHLAWSKAKKKNEIWNTFVTLKGKKNMGKEQRRYFSQNKRHIFQKCDRRCHLPRKLITRHNASGSGWLTASAKKNPWGKPCSGWRTWTTTTAQ